MTDQYLYLENKLKEFNQVVSDINETEFKYVGFDKDWLKPKNIKGFSAGSLTNIRKAFKKRMKRCRDEEIVAQDVRKLKCVNDAERFIIHASEYIDSLNNDQFSNRNWYFYFYDISSREEGEAPKLGCAILKTRKRGFAEFINVSNDDDPNSGYYEGKYEIMSHSRVMVFNLRKDKLRNLHIKTQFYDYNDEVQVASYNTFDGMKVFWGRALMKYTESEIAQNSTTLLSHWINSKKFLEVEPKTIIHFLSRKEANYGLLPNISRLIDKLEKTVIEQPLFKNIEQRFIELPKPKVFVAAQRSALAENDNSILQENIQIESMCQRLSDDLSDQFDVRIPKGIDNEMEEMGRNRGNKTVSIKSLKLLQRTRFFIYFISGGNALSFASIQMGWALAYCKHIMIIYKDGSISKRVEKFSNQKNATDQELVFSIKRRPYKDFKNESDEIWADITSFLKDNFIRP